MAQVPTGTTFFIASAFGSAINTTAVSNSAPGGEAVVTTASAHSYSNGDTVEISTADESVDIFWASIGPKGRTLVTAAYNHLNQPKPSEAADFLASATVSAR